MAVPLLARHVHLRLPLRLAGGSSESILPHPTICSLAFLPNSILSSYWPVSLFFKLITVTYICTV